MKINFRKEGYVVGQKLFMVKENYVASNNAGDGKEVEVTYVGPSVLKVTDGENEFKFNGEMKRKGVVFGIFFKLYQSEADYLRIKGEEESANQLKKEITQELEGLSLKDLRLLSDYLKQMK